MKYILLLATVALCSCANPQAKVLSNTAIGILERRGEISAQDAIDLRDGTAIIFTTAPTPVETLPDVEVSGK